MQKIIQKFLTLGLNEEDEFDPRKTPANLNDYDWKLTGKKEYERDCPAVRDQPHKQNCECFFSEQVPGWEENMKKVFSQEPTEQIKRPTNEKNQKTEAKRKSERLQTQIQVSNKKLHLLRNGKGY